jgi:hypothetical protein
MVVDIFGFAEFGSELIKTLIGGGILAGVPLYYTLFRKRNKGFNNLMFEVGLKNKKDKVPLVISEQEKEYGKNYVLHVPEGLCIDDFEKGKTKLEHTLGGILEFESIGNQNILMKQISMKLQRIYEYTYEKLPIMKFALGYSYTGKEYLKLCNDDVSILVGGGTGKGKSSFLHLLLVQLILNNHNMIDIYLSDLMRKEFMVYERCMYVKDLCYDIGDTLQMLYKLKHILSDRMQCFEAGINNIYKYNAKYPLKKWKFIICFIDEFADITLTPNKKDNIETQLLLSELERKGRAIGMHFVLSTQHPNAQTVPACIKKHLLVNVAFSVQDRYCSEAIIDHSGAEKLKETGRAIIKNSEGEKEIQTFYVDVDQVEDLIKHTFIKKTEAVENDVIGVARKC